MRKVYYYIVSTISFLLLAIGFYGTKLASVAVVILVYSFLNKFIGEWGKLPAGLVGLISGGLMFFILQKLYPYHEKFDVYRKRFKKYPYIELYGTDYPQPTPEDFSITQAEFKDYNNRFQFEYIQIILSFGPWIGSNIYLISHKMDKLTSALIFIGGIIVCISMYCLFTFINVKLSQKHQHYHKIKSYQNANSIFYKIEQEKAAMKS